MQLLAHQWAKRFHVNTNMYIIFSYFLKEKYNYLLYITAMKYQVSFHENLISSHVKISLLLWLQNKSRLSHQETVKVKWFGISLVFI